MSRFSSMGDAAVDGLRRLWLLMAGNVLVLLLVRRDVDPTSPVLEYKVRAAVVVLALGGIVAWWWNTREVGRRGMEIVPAVLGTIAALVLSGALAGTDYAPGGIDNDQSFRTAAVTRFADSWHNADYTMNDLPSFYPPGYFWVLGRVAVVFDVEPWRMLKIGAVLTALVVPMIAYVLWRRIVPDRIAALFAVVVIAVENFYEPYSWLVLVMIIPWWLEVAHGLRREGARPGSPVALGLLGALMMLTYWYFFAIAGLALLAHLGVQRATGGVNLAQLRRAAVVMGIALAGSAVYWLPALISVLRADNPEFLTNRWFNSGHAALPLPMLDNDAVGVLAFIGFVYLVWAARKEAVARGLLCFLVAGYAWYLLGAFAAVHEHPLLSFRGKPIIPMVLLLGAVLGLVRAVEFGLDRLHRGDALRVVFAVTAVVAVYVCQGFVSAVWNSPVVAVAQTTSPPDWSPPDPSAVDMQAMIEREVGTHATLLSVRTDVLVLYPNHAFLPWVAHYAHPAAEFTERAEFVQQLAAAGDAEQFASLAADNPFERIDAFVLQVDPETGDFIFYYRADMYPDGAESVFVTFAPSLFEEFEVIAAGGYVLAVPR